MVAQDGGNLVREQVFDRSGTYLGTVCRATLDSRGVEVEAYEIELTDEAGQEIHGEPGGSVTVSPRDLQMMDVIRLTATIPELRDDEA